MTAPLVLRRSTLRITASNIEEITGIPKAIVDKTLSEPHMIDALPLRTVRLLARLLQVPTVEALFTVTETTAEPTPVGTRAAAAALAALHEMGDWVSIRHLRAVLGPETPDPETLNEEAERNGLTVLQHGNQIRLVTNADSVTAEHLAELREMHLASSEPQTAQAEILYAVMQGQHVPDSDSRTALMNAGLLKHNGTLSDQIRHSITEAWTRSYEHVPIEQLSFLEAS